MMKEVLVALWEHQRGRLCARRLKQAPITLFL